MPITVMHYMYRDASNYKQFGEHEFAGAITPEQIARFEATLDDQSFVVENLDQVRAEGEPEIGMVNLREEISGEYDDDTNWNEFLRFEVRGNVEPYDGMVSVEQLVARFEAVANGDGWDETGEAHLPHMIVHGSLFGEDSGLRFVGPFTNRTKAETYVSLATHLVNPAVVKLEAPMPRYTEPHTQLWVSIKGAAYPSQASVPTRLLDGVTLPGTGATLPWDVVAAIVADRKASYYATGTTPGHIGVVALTSDEVQSLTKEHA